MSIKVFSLGTIGVRHQIESYVREHGSELAIGGIMTAILVGVAALATGDVMQALARSGHH